MNRRNLRRPALILVTRFVSRPDLRPPSVQIDRRNSHAQDVFLTPMRGPVQWGPMIVDHTGSLVWFAPVTGAKTLAADFRVQHYLGHTVLTWWQGYVNFGVGEGYNLIYDSHYRPLGIVQALLDKGAAVNDAPKVPNPSDEIFAGLRTPLMWAAATDWRTATPSSTSRSTAETCV